MPASKSLTVVAAAFLVGCGAAETVSAPADELDLLCTGVIQAGIVVEVVDARTGAPAARGAVGAVRDGAFIDSLRPAVTRGTPPADTLLSLQGAFERPGSYEVTIAREGFRPWSQSGVVVSRGVCHVNTVTVTARLTPTQ